MRKYVLYIICALVLSSCQLGGGPVVPPVAPPAVDPPAVDIPEVDLPEGDPPEVSLPGGSSSGSGSESDSDSENGTSIFALNMLGMSNSDGVEVEIVRVLIGYKDVVESRTDHDFSEYEYYDDATLLGEIIFKVVNNSGQDVTLAFRDGQVVINSEEIDLSDFEMPEIGSSLNEMISDGSEVYGGIWFGISDTDFEDITTLRFVADAPMDGGASPVGTGFDMTADLTEHDFEEIPDEFPQDFHDEFPEEKQ